MKEVGSRRRNQPAPPWAVFDDLCDPDRQPVRPWLLLQDDEIAPTVVDSDRPMHVVWSSLWIKRPDASVRFELTAARGGTDTAARAADAPLSWATAEPRSCRPPEVQRLRGCVAERRRTVGLPLRSTR